MVLVFAAALESAVPTALAASGTARNANNFRTKSDRVLGFARTVPV